MKQQAGQIAAVIAAAGRSRRMGEPKQLLPWGDDTVIATVVKNLATAGADPILCITGHRHAEIASALTTTSATVLYNETYATADMLRSYQIGLAALDGEHITGAILALGDQPHIPATVLQQIVAQARCTPDKIVVPSYNMRRGHPFYMPRQIWSEIIALQGDETLRVVVNRHSDAITYVTVDDDAILQDMDTPEAYETLRKAHEAL